MSVVLPLTAEERGLAERYPPTFLTFLFTLRRRRSVPPDLFYAYWRDAHCQISARLPGIHSLWIHFLDYEGGRIWPAIDGIARELADEDRFEGVPEPTFISEEDFGRFGAAMTPLMNDEVNIFEEIIGYQAVGENSRTFVDRLSDPAPDADEGALRLMVFCKQADGIPVEQFRSFMVERLAPTWAHAEEVLKLRLHLFEPYVNQNLIMDAQDVRRDKAPAKQYQGCFEIVFADAIGMRRFAASAAWLDDEQRSHMREQHPFLVRRRYSMRYNGTMTLTGLRTAAVAEQIRRIGALNQLAPDVVELMGAT
jgi:hypothetical protein